jgi:hypothetical protein
LTTRVLIYADLLHMQAELMHPETCQQNVTCSFLALAATSFDGAVLAIQ